MTSPSKEAGFVDVNTASVEELAKIPRLSRSLAEGIAASRPYARLEDLLKVRGMGEKLLAQLKPYLKISPLDVNRASVEEIAALERFPRLLAERLVEGRPYASLEEIRKVRGMGPRLFEQYSPYLFAGAVDLTPPPPAAEVIDAPPPEAVVAVGPTTDTQSVFYPAPEPPREKVFPAPEPPPAEAEAPRSSGFFKQPVWSRAIQVIAPEASYASEEKSAPAAPRTVRTDTLLWGAGAALLTLLLSIAFNLALLAIINGGLRYAPSRELTTLQSQVSVLESQARTLQQDLDSLRVRLDSMQALSGRIDTLEEEQAALQQDIASASQQVQAVQEQIDAVQEQVTEIEQRTTAFGQFLDGLKNLLQEIWNPAP